MKHYLRISALLAVLLFLLPLATVRVIRNWSDAGEQEPEPIEILPPGAIDSADTIRVLLGDTVTEMPMNTYLACVLRAEMPASFEQEALCAQAVAARTYTYYKLHAGGNHGATADICGDSTCCQAYLSQEAAEKNWGDKAAYYEAKIENAVSATDGQVALYQDAPILAVFHSSSAQRTKSSGEVWLQDLPYLQSVSSPEKGDEIPNYYSRAEFTADEFRNIFRGAHPEAELSGDCSGWVRDLTLSASGSVQTVCIGGVRVKGTELRRLYALRSTTFELETQGGKLIFYVTGFGHGVGMSQYGANEMAREGATWQEIIRHYYSGVEIGTYALH